MARCKAALESRHRAHRVLFVVASRHGILARQAALPLAQVYTDEQIAGVLSYVGERWHRWKKPADPAAITRMRKDHADRKTPWTAKHRGRRTSCARP